jgi:hypothetical protein
VKPFPLLALATALLAGCGVPGEPLPPLLEIPAPVQDLTAAQVGAEIQLAWSRPRLTTEGTRPLRLDRVELYGAFRSEGTQPPRFPEESRLLAALSLRNVPEAQERMAYTVALDASQLGAEASFAVRALNDRGRDAGFSNVVTLRIANLPAPPAALQAVVTERAVRLSWSPSEQSAFGGTAAAPPAAVDGYQVLRREAGSPGSGTVVGETQAPAYDDASFEFARTYVYTVRAFVRQGEALAVTPPSAPTELAAVDRFPPAPPGNVRAVVAAGAVEIAWSPNEESDLAGYNVYRSDGGEFSRANSEPLRIPVFRDATVRAGVRYRYHVRAADRNGNESAPSEEVSVIAE